MMVLPRNFVVRIFHRMSVTIPCYVTPKAKKPGTTVDNNTINVKVSAPPDKGKANKAVLTAIAKELGLSTGKVELISGLTSRNKTVRIHTDLDAEQILNILQT